MGDCFGRYNERQIVICNTEDQINNCTVITAWKLLGKCWCSPQFFQRNLGKVPSCPWCLCLCRSIL